MYGHFITNHIDQVTANLVLHKRYTASYRPWLLNITVDCCALLRDANHHAWGNVALTLLMRIISKAYPSILTGCPFEVRK